MRAGDTVSLRIRTDAGATEIVGIVLVASADSLTVRRRTGEVVEIRRSDVAAGRVVPPSPAQRISAAELQTIMAGGWRALESEPLGDWLLRAGAGFTGRANSVLPVGDPGLPLEDAVARVEAWYDARGLPPRVQLPDHAAPAGLDRILEARGWISEWPTHVMTAELAPVLRGLPASAAEVRLDDAPDEAWLAAYRPDEGRGGTPEEVIRALLTNHSNAVFASVREDDRCVAIARAAVDGRWVGLFCVEVAADRRRTGLGTAVSVAALRSAVTRGARRAYLQVTVDNTSARALYERLGFGVHHDYRYYTLSGRKRGDLSLTP